MSGRQYFRILEDNQSYIISQTDPDQKKDFLNLLNIHNFLQTNFIPVPEIYLVDQKNQFIWQEDGGEILLDYLRRKKLDTKETENLYKEIIRILVNAQTAKRDRCVAFNQSFSLNKIKKEYQDLIKPIIDDKSIENFYLKVASNMTKSFKVFCFRDFQSTNVLINNIKKLTLIDFQGARLALPQYDLVSLLEDNYLNLSPNLKENLIEFYLKEYSVKSGQFIDKKEFLEIYQDTLIQRKLHDWGIFVRAYRNTKNRKYLKYIKRITRFLSKNTTFDNLSSI